MCESGDALYRWRMKFMHYLDLLFRPRDNPCLFIIISTLHTDSRGIHNLLVGVDLTCTWELSRYQNLYKIKSLWSD